MPFLGLLPFCLVCPILTCLLLFYLTIFYHIFTCLFLMGYTKGINLDGHGGGEEVGMVEMENCTQDILYEKSL